MDRPVRIATRQSKLALWQTHHVRDRLLALDPECTVEIVGMTTRGDRIQDRPLAEVGGKGLFVKELEAALLDDRADIAVHSMKDVPMELHPDLKLGVILAREDPRDALVANEATSLETLPAGAVVGTSSLRRQSQLAALRRDLVFEPLRGNVDTRLGKLDDGQYQAIVLAVSGLVRLGLKDRIASAIPVDACLPAAGQGAIGIEYRREDTELAGFLGPLNDASSFQRVSAERAVSRHLEASCDVPVAAYAEHEDETLRLTALVASIDGARLLKIERQGSADAPDDLGTAVADELLQHGAAGLLST